MSKALATGLVPQPARQKKIRAREETPKGVVLHVHGKGKPREGWKHRQKTVSIYPVILDLLNKKAYGRNETAVFNAILAAGLAHFLKEPCTRKTIRELIEDTLGETVVNKIMAEDVDFIDD